MEAAAIIEVAKQNRSKFTENYNLRFRVSVFTQGHKAAVISFFRVFAEKTRGKLVVHCVISNTATTLSVVLAGIGTGTVHGFIGITGHVTTLTFQKQYKASFHFISSSSGIAILSRF